MIKKEFLIAVSLSALLLGCVDSSTGAAARADMESGDTHKVEAKAEAPKKAEVAEKAEAPVAESAPVEEAKAEESATAETPEAPVAKEAPAEEAKAEAPATEKPAEEKAAAPVAEVNLGACKGCHGADFEKKAMNVSKIVKDLSKDDIVKAIKGYKDGSYGGAMKGLMKGQVASLDDAAIEAVAATIAK